MTKRFVKVQEIEAKALQLIKDAKKRAAHIIFEAKSSGEQAVEDNIDKAQKETLTILEQAKKSAGKEALEINTKNKKEIENLIEKAKNKINQAKKLI